MSIKVNIDRSKKTPSEREYPWIGEHTGTVVLFSGPSTGMVVENTDADSCYGPGDFGDSWCEDRFVEFEGTITLSN